MEMPQNSAHNMGIFTISDVFHRALPIENMILRPQVCLKKKKTISGWFQLIYLGLVFKWDLFTGWLRLILVQPFLGLLVEMMLAHLRDEWRYLHQPDTRLVD